MHPPENDVDFNIIKRNFAAFPDKTQLLTAYHNLIQKKRIEPNKNIEKLLTRRKVRTLSGVTIVTSLVKPFACPGKCVYCPLDARMPKSYLPDEPAAARGLALAFDPYKQMKKRIEALESNGHPTEKIELIIKGGTWNAYPLNYQYWFILESFRAANADGLRTTDYGKTLISGPEDESLSDLKRELLKQQKLNEHAKHRIIGLTLETRPDSISEKTLWEMREQGCTRLEIGVQTTDDEILKKIKRGHTTEQVKAAAESARNFGFKVDFHLMPQLPGATPESDLLMLNSIFSDPGYKPDMIKIYPCTVVKGSELYDWFEKGLYRAYSTDDLIDVLKKFKTNVPYYVRISRLIRDIPGTYIKDGNKATNLRQVLQNEMKAEGTSCRCLRCREVGHVDLKALKYKNIKPELFIEKYETRGGTEYFLSFEDRHRQVIFAFCRLRILSEPASTGKYSWPFEAYIRELHTYGQLVRIGKKEKESSQHKGLGKKLMKEAEKIASKNGLKKLAVISGVGVRGYYRALGYRLNKTYLVKKL